MGNVKASAWRLMNMYLRMTEDVVAFRDFEQVEVIEEQTESPAYPGVMTIYKKHIVEAYICTAEIEELQKYGLPDMKPFKLVSKMQDTRTWAWQSRKQAEEL